MQIADPRKEDFRLKPDAGRGRGEDEHTVKRILALAGAVILAVMYIITLVFALSGSENYWGMLMASVAATIIVPVVIYGYTLVYRLLKGRTPDMTEGDGREPGTASEKKDSGIPEEDK